jgi:class 3 adenylate cyclase
VTEAERDHCLRCLRFPLELEYEFQQAFFNRTLKPMRLGIIVMAGLMLTQQVRNVSLGNMDPTLGVAAAALLVFVAATFHHKFPRVWKPSVTLAYLLIALPTMAQAAAIINADVEYPTAQSKLFVLIVFQIIGMVFCAAGGRLPFLWTMLVLAGIEAGAVGIVIRNFAPPPEILSGVYLTNTLIVIVTLMLANLTLERFQRGDFLANRLLDEERFRSDKLLLSILPEPIAQRLKTQPGIIADNHPEVTVLFADIVDFTPLSARLTASQVVALLNDIFSAFDALADKHGLEKIKTIGDAYMVAAGLPEPRPDHADAIAEMALDMRTVISNFDRSPGQVVQARFGIHTGPVVAGVIGKQKTTYDLWGDTVNTASRMESHGCAGVIQVTEATYLLLRERYQFTGPQDIEVKGRGQMRVYRLQERLTSSECGLSG